MARVIQVNKEAMEGIGPFGPIPAGTKLRVSIYEIEEGVAGPNSKNPGSPQFHYTAKVVEDFPFTFVDDEGKTHKANARGREIKFNYVPLDPNVAHAWNLTAFAEAVSWPIDTKAETVEVPDDLREVLGTEVIAKIGTQVSQSDGKVYNRVERVFKPKPGGGGGGTPPAPKPTWDNV